MSNRSVTDRVSVYNLEGLSGEGGGDSIVGASKEGRSKDITRARRKWK